MRKTKEEADATREKLLDAALGVFSKKGYAIATLDDIAGEAGVTRGALYWHFKGGKPEVFQALIKERSRGVEGIMAEILGSGRSPLKKLEDLMIRLMEYMEEDPDFRAVQEVMMFKTEMLPELAEGMEEKYEAQRQSLELAVGLIEQGKKLGEIRKDVDPRTAAIAAIGLLNGVMIIWLLDDSLYSLKSSARPVVRTFIEGLAP